MFSFTKEEFEIIRHALTLRESAMLRDAEAYRDQKNLEAQKDCMDEWRKTHALNEKIYKEGSNSTIPLIKISDKR